MNICLFLRRGRVVLVSLLCCFVLLPQIVHAVSGKEEAGLISKIKERYPDFVPKGIIDIGANKGEWSEQVRGIYNTSKILMLEASHQHDEALLQMAQRIGNAQHKIAVLSERPGETVEFFQGGDTGNSMFKENTRFYKNDSPVTRITSTLDLEIENSTFRNEEVSIIKIDVQGAELMVLKGAQRALSQATFVSLEASTIEYNSGAPCQYEVDEFLRSKGFFLYDFGELLTAPHLFHTLGVGQYDVLYVKPSSPKLPNRMKMTKFCGASKANSGTQESQSQRQEAENMRAFNDYGIGESSNEFLRNSGLSHAGAFVFGFVSATILLPVLLKTFGCLEKRIIKRN